MNWLDGNTLALIFAGLTAVAILLYAMLDGYDLGVGITLPMGQNEQEENEERENTEVSGAQDEQWRDTSIASIGPFWDANETWLVLAVGLLLVAFPAAHSAILEALYLPAAILLIGLILRGVAFDFRAKVKPQRKRTWDWVFKIGSIIAACSQGFMLGMYVVGLEYTLGNLIFAMFSGLCVTAAYALIGNAWLIMKTTGALQARSIKTAKRAGVVAFMGILSVSLINPLVNSNVYQVWTQPPFAYFFALIPVICFGMFLAGYQSLKQLPRADHKFEWLPFAICCVIFLMAFIGLAVSFYPFVVPNELTIYEAASAAESLNIIFAGAIFVIPIIGLYTAFTYYAFRGKAEGLKYY